MKLSRTPGDHARVPAPALGEHTREVLSGLGYGEQEIDELMSSGAVAGGEEPGARDAGLASRA